MDKLAQLNAAVKRMFPSSTVITTAEVVSIEGDTCTVKVNADSNIPGMNLRATGREVDSKLLITPRVGSFVLIGSQSGDFRDCNVLAVEEPETLSIEAEKITILIDVANGKITINEGELGGMVKVIELTQKLNAIESAFNQLLAHYKSHNHLHPQGPTTAFVTPPTQSDLSQTKRSDIENEAITQ